MKRESKNHRSRWSTENGGPPETIAFRLDAKGAEALAKKAEELGVSPHLLAKHCVLEKLSEPYSALHLMHELHFKTQEQEHGFAIQGVPEELCQSFSKRRKQIIEALETAGDTQAGNFGGGRSILLLCLLDPGVGSSSHSLRPS